MELGWGGFDRAKLDMLMLIRIPFSFHVLEYRCSSLWPISETITCNARDVIWRTDYGEKTVVFMAAEDSSEGLVKAATRKKVYKCLEVC